MVAFLKNNKRPTGLIKMGVYMKRILYLVLVIFLATNLSACSVSSDKEQITKKEKPISIIELKEEVNPITIEYTGVVEANDITKLGFKSSGIVESVYVKVGDHIKAGDKLAKLDTKQLEYMVQASAAQVGSAKSNYDKALNGATDEEIKKAEATNKKAEDAYNYSKDNFEKKQMLYDSGAISKTELDAAKLDSDIKESDYNYTKEILNEVKRGARDEDKNAAQNQLKQAEANYNNNLTVLDDAMLKSDIEGYVADILYSEGEMVSAGYPVVILRSEKMCVSVGLSKEDIVKVEKGTKANIISDGIEVQGKVNTIAELPDSQSRTYEVEIELEEAVFPIGSIVDVDIIVGEHSGIWIPIKSVLSNGEDYVYIVSENTAIKRKVKIEESKGSLVKVSGLKKGEILVVEGMTKLFDQDKVIVQK